MPRPRHDFGHVRQGGVQLPYLFRGGALLRTEGMRGAVRAAQRIVDVGGDLDHDAAQARVQAAGVHLPQIGQRRAAGRQCPAVRIQPPYAQRCQHARAAVVGGRPAQAHDEAPRAGIQSGADQFAHAMAAGAQGIALRRRGKFQAGRGGHFDDRGGVIGQPAPAGPHRFAQRAAHGCFAPLAAGGGQHGLDRAFAAVGHRDAQGMGAGTGLPDAARDGGGGVGGRQAFLE